MTEPVELNGVKAMCAEMGVSPATYWRTKDQPGRWPKPIFLGNKIRKFRKGDGYRHLEKLLAARGD